MAIFTASDNGGEQADPDKGPQQLNGYEYSPDRERLALQHRVQRYTYQIQEGCGRQDCYSYLCSFSRKRKKYTVQAAQILACYFVTEKKDYMCPNLLIPDKRCKIEKGGSLVYELSENIFNTNVSTTLVDQRDIPEYLTDESMLELSRGGRTDILRTWIYNTLADPYQSINAYISEVLTAIASNRLEPQTVLDSFLKCLDTVLQSRELETMDIYLCFTSMFEWAGAMGKPKPGNNFELDKYVVPLYQAICRSWTSYPKGVEVAKMATNFLQSPSAKNCVSQLVYAIESLPWTGNEITGFLPGALYWLAEILRDGREIESLRSERIEERLRLTNPPGRHTDFSWLRDDAPPHLLHHRYLFSLSTRLTYFHAYCLQRMNLSHHRALESRALTEQITNQASNIAFRGLPRGRNMWEVHQFAAPYLLFEVRREHVLEDAFDQLRNKSAYELRKPLKARFINTGEEGFDQGGLQKEFLTLVFQQAMDPVYGMWQYDPETRLSTIQPMSGVSVKHFEYLGILLGTAFYNNIVLPISIPQFIYQRLLGEKVTFESIEEDFPALCQGLRSLLEWEDSDVSDVFMRTYDFAFDRFGATVTTPMSKSSKPNEVLVTNKNRGAYIHDYLAQLTRHSISAELDAFCRGFHQVVNGRIQELFSGKDLQRVVQGEGNIDTSLLEAVTGYDDGYHAVHPLIRDFWTIVHNSPLDLKKSLLRFVTASDRIPVQGYGSITFVIQRVGADSSRLPSAQTCFGRLLLPEYKSKDKLERLLLKALEHSSGFGVP